MWNFIKCEDGGDS